MTNVLVVIGGLPGSGKSTIATALARRAGMPYLRVDRIEQAIVDWSTLDHPVGPAGYAVAHSLAAEQLGVGLDVVVECVNPVALTRDPWPITASGAGAAIVEVEVVCSDAAEHRRRVAARASDVPGLIKPTWRDILDREYEPWTRSRVLIDSCQLSVEQAVDRLSTEIARQRSTFGAADEPEST